MVEGILKDPRDASNALLEVLEDDASRLCYLILILGGDSGVSTVVETKLAPKLELACVERPWWRCEGGWKKDGKECEVSPLGDEMMACSGVSNFLPAQIQFLYHFSPSCTVSHRPVLLTKFVFLPSSFSLHSFAMVVDLPLFFLTEHQRSDWKHHKPSCVKPSWEVML